MIDDGSTDSTLQVARAYENRMRLRILRPHPQGNWLAMTNVGLSEATGSWCCILHQDDRWHPDCLTSGLPTLLSTHSLSMICLQTELMDERGKRVGCWRFPSSVRQYVSEPVRAPLASSLYVQNWLSVPSVIFDTVLARHCGGLDESLWYTADWDMWLKLLSNAPAILVESTGASFRIHSQSQTALRSLDSRAFRMQLEVVQRRHQWAISDQPRARSYRRAGDLSTRTNAALAAAFHLRPSGYWSWAGSLALAGFRGVIIYFTNSSILDRILPRLRLLARRSLRSSSSSSLA